MVGAWGGALSGIIWYSTRQPPTDAECEDWHHQKGGKGTAGSIVDPSRPLLPLVPQGEPSVPDWIRRRGQPAWPLHGWLVRSLARTAFIQIWRP